MDKPSIVEALQRQAKTEVISVVGICDLADEDAAQNNKTIKIEVLPTLVVDDIVNIGTHLNLILENNLYSSSSPLMIKSPTPTPPPSPKPLSKNTPSP